MMDNPIVLADTGAIFSFKCSVCGKVKVGEAPTAIDTGVEQRDNICSTCYTRGLLWAVIQAAKVRGTIE